VTSPAGRYVASTLAPSTETGQAVVCTVCGTLVADTAAHDRFHGELPRRPARPARVT